MPVTKKLYKAKFCGKELQRLFYRAHLQGGVTVVQLQGRKAEIKKNVKIFIEIHPLGVKIDAEHGGAIIFTSKSSKINEFSHSISQQLFRALAIGNCAVGSPNSPGANALVIMHFITSGCMFLSNIR